MNRILCAVLWAGLLPARALAAGDGLEKAMEAELGRAMGELQEKDYPKTYYVSLAATDINSWEEHCAMGARGFLADFRNSIITPDLRVGDYAFDNHPVSPSSSFVAAGTSFEDDEFALRHGLWRLLDGAYKGAAAAYLRKQALRVQRGKTEYDTDDLSREAPRVRMSRRPASRWEPGALSLLCREGSGVFREMPGLLGGEAEVRTRRLWTRFRDSEGSKVDFDREVAEVELEAVALSSDGLRLTAVRRFTSPTPEGLPSADQVRKAARDMIEDLKALQVAKTTSPFSAPALIDPSVSAAVVLAIGARLSGEEQRNPGGAQTFRGRMGKPVLPPEFTLEDDPTLEYFGATPLAGHYDYDDQGVAARKATLVERGVLKGLLLSRYPVIGFPKSNGHARGFPGHPPDGSPGVMLLRSSAPLTQEKLLERLRAECQRRGKAYGFWVRKLRAHVQQQGTGGQGSIRLMPGLLYLVEASTGKLTLVRDLDMVGTPLAMLGNIIAAGSDLEAQNVSIAEPASAVVPSLLLADAEIQRAETKPEKAPILPPPAP